MSYIEAQSTLNIINNDTSKTRFSQGQQRVGSSDIGKDGFLQLLLAQLKHQDPMNPVDNTEFLAQQAQFTQIEKLDQLNSSINKANAISQAGTMIGKNIEYVVLDSNGNTIRGENGQPLLATGKVDSVHISEGSVGLKVNGNNITTDLVTQIFSE